MFNLANWLEVILREEADEIGTVFLLPLNGASRVNDCLSNWFLVVWKVVHGFRVLLTEAPLYLPSTHVISQHSVFFFFVEFEGVIFCCELLHTMALMNIESRVGVQEAWVSRDVGRWLGRCPERL